MELYLICAFGEGGCGAVRAPGQGKGVGSVLHPLRSCSSSCRPHWRAVDQLESSSLNTKPDSGELPGAYCKHPKRILDLQTRIRKGLGWNVGFNCRAAGACVWISPWYAVGRPADPSEQTHRHQTQTLKEPDPCGSLRLSIIILGRLWWILSGDYLLSKLLHVLVLFAVELGHVSGKLKWKCYSLSCYRPDNTHKTGFGQF